MSEPEPCENCGRRGGRRFAIPWGRKLLIVCRTCYLSWRQPAGEA